MKRKTIRNHKDFLTTPDDPSVANFFFVIKRKDAVKKDARYGVIASKRVFKLATQRHRAKRVLRDRVAFNEPIMLPNKDYSCMARNGIFGSERDIGRIKMAHLLKKLSK